MNKFSSQDKSALIKLASSRTAAKTGEKELGERHPEVKRAIEGLSKKVQALDDEMADVVKLADKAEAALARESGSGERTDEEEVAAEAAGAAGRLLRDLQKVSKHLSDATDLLNFYKREL